MANDAILSDWTNGAGLVVILCHKWQEFRAGSQGLINWCAVNQHGGNASHIGADTVLRIEQLAANLATDGDYNRFPPINAWN